MVQKKEIKVADIKGIGTKTFLEWLDDDRFLGMLVDAGVIEKDKVDIVKYSSMSKHARDEESYPVLGLSVGMSRADITPRAPFLGIEVSKMPKLLPGRVDYDYWHILKRILEHDVLTGQTLEEMLVDVNPGDLFEVGPKGSRKEFYEKLINCLEDEKLPDGRIVKGNKLKDGAKPILDELKGKANGDKLLELLVKRRENALRMMADENYEPRIPIQKGSVKATIERPIFADGTKGPPEVNIIFDEKIKTGEIKHWRIVMEYEGDGSTLKLKDYVNWWRELSDEERQKLGFRKLDRETVKSLNIAEYSLANAEWRRAWKYIGLESARGGLIALGLAAVIEGFLLGIDGFKKEGVSGALLNIFKAAGIGAGWTALDLVAKRYFTKLEAKAIEKAAEAAAKSLARRAIFWGVARVGARIATKAIPVVGWGLLVYDIGDFLYGEYLKEKEIKKRWQDPSYFYMRQKIDEGKEEEHEVSTRGIQFISTSEKGIHYIEDARAVKYFFKDGSEIELADEVVSPSDPWVPKPIASQLPKLPEVAIKMERNPDCFLRSFATGDPEKVKWFKEHGLHGAWDVIDSPPPMISKVVWVGDDDDDDVAHTIWAQERDKYRTQWISVAPPADVCEAGQPRFYWYRDWTGDENIMIVNLEETMSLIPNHKLKDLLENIKVPED